ncbi:MAG: hypothetical protein KME49_15480 [Brasilonema octagenarum HA4186-MV1]|nr:hypothetical protein [Brasilonema octagenarum HA4186-MV1]
MLQRGEPPFWFTSRLCRETLSEVATTRLTPHQIPLSGNPHQVLAPQGTTLGSAGFTATQWLLSKQVSSCSVVFVTSSQIIVQANITRKGWQNMPRISMYDHNYA